MAGREPISEEQRAIWRAEDDAVRERWEATGRKPLEEKPLLPRWEVERDAQRRIANIERARRQAQRRRVAKKLPVHSPDYYHPLAIQPDPEPEGLDFLSSMAADETHWDFGKRLKTHFGRSNEELLEQLHHCQIDWTPYQDNPFLARKAT